MFVRLSLKLKLWLAELLARTFNRVCDPEVEARISSRAEFIDAQELRRQKLVESIHQYFGPRV